ncbi:SDR family NAD(P)-dependent oxidoreductase [Roseobacter sp. HKCC-CH-9208]|jgi:NAD(P)-dependent dehydrogenase (short-subunit alcohol dehydrogenase family)|uniref:SDR family NAD(P)-dependent oxidoreductase n=1 Tax=Roseobacter sp. HKCC-CH-9208 TaxID=3120339 RepID=UPI0030EC93C2
MKNAVVIGGTGGIGAGIARVLLREGWHVLATGLDEREIDAFSFAVPSVETAVLDVTDQGQVTEFFNRFETLDALVNCAGVLFRGAEYEMDVFTKVIEINLTGTMRTCLAAHELLARSKGAIVNTASMLSTFGGPLVPAYSASKGGVSQLTKALAGKWAADGIRVNAIAPGWIETEMTAALREDPERNGPILARTPMGRWGKPDEIGELVAWLLSHRAGFITGAIYPVDGGYSAM